MLTRFETRKKKILEQLATPDAEYHDLSPKGSVDAPIRALIEDINNLNGLVTTSSCSGRVSVFLEGRKAEAVALQAQGGDQLSAAGPGGKGGGGQWLYISHDPLPKSGDQEQDWMALFGLQQKTSAESNAQAPSRYVHLKFEPMILHILTASLQDCQRVITAALSAGFRESGAVSLTPSSNGELNPIVAVRSTGYSNDSIIGYHDEHGHNIALVDEQYLRHLVDIANERFQINTERIARFRDALLEQYNSQNIPKQGDAGSEWEDAEVRKMRKREEGLRRQQALKARNRDDSTDSVQDQGANGEIGGLFG